MLLKGLDVGYDSTKDNQGRCVRSAYAFNNVNEESKITINGVTYYVGTGKMISEVDKTSSEMNMVCTIYNLIKSNARELCLVVGLPIAQYDTQKIKLKDSIISYNNLSVYYKGKPYEFKIHDVIVERQGISSLYTLPDLNGQYILVDIGGFSVDPCLVEFGVNGVELLERDTWYNGIRTIYSDIVELVNNKYEINLKPSAAENILLQGLTLYGKTQDISFIKPLYQDYIDQLAENIKLKYPYATVPIYLTGGGAILLYNSFCKRFANVHMIKNPRFANAIGYYNIGYYKFLQRGVKVG